MIENLIKYLGITENDAKPYLEQQLMMKLEESKSIKRILKKAQNEAIQVIS